MNFPEQEQLNHVDIFSGMSFFFVRNSGLKDNEKPLFLDPDPVFWDDTKMWTVIGKEYMDEPLTAMRGRWKFLLLGPNSTLRWHHGQLGWIKRVADPVWEERYQREGDFTGW